MGDDTLREELQILNGYCEELKKALVTGQVISPYRLLIIADHITLCDHLVQSRFEKVIVSWTLSYWEKCAKQWMRQKINKMDSKINPQKNWEVMITKEDEEFLKNLYSGKI
ncbi:MAG: hypothetical protein Q7S43_01540 [bacterium]|nr:hypothetical protein [bacterium]